MNLEDDTQYWIEWETGERILVVAYVDRFGNIDVEGVNVDFRLWLGQKSDPQNREGINRIVKVES